MNMMKTFLLLGLLSVLLVIAGQALGGTSGMQMAFVFTLLMNFGSYWFSDKIVLMLYRARPASPRNQPELYRMVGSLAARAGLPMPKLYLIDDDSPNAFATGRNPQHATVAVTTGILRILDQKELQGVLGHELAHIKNRDILIGTVAATLAGAIAMLSRMAYFFGGRSNNDNRGSPAAALLLMIVGPIAAMIIQMAISRSREYSADRLGAQIAGSPHYLASGLRELLRLQQRSPLLSAHPTSAHLFIVNPLSARGVLNLFSTHPPLEERIRRLEAMA